MEPLRSERVKSIFLRAAKLNGPKRDAVLDADCAGDLELRQRVEQLLAQNDRTATMEILPRSPRMAHAPTLERGQLVSGRFRIDRLIGKGGMGEVYEASDEELGGRLALKIILPGLLHEEQMLGRFRREVHLARQVTHPNVCRIFDVGRDSIGGHELWYLTMELIDGETLTAFLKHEGKLRPADALPLLRQVSAGLGALHEKNIVHRDLKPSNVMIVRASTGTLRVVIGDFGLARAVLEDSLEDGLSRSGLVMGTPGYMAPEQLAGLRVSVATDVFSLGVVAYEMVTGRPAFPARHGDTLPPAPREVAPELPVEWEQVILRCMEKEPGHRPASAEAVTEALAGTTKLAPVRVERPSRRISWVGGAAAVVLVVFGGWAWRGMQRGTAVAALMGGGANATYLEATDLLDHAYRPGATEKAIQLLEPVSTGPDATALVHAALGRGYFRQFLETRDANSLEKAKQSSARAIALDGQLATPRVVLGRVFTRSGKSDLAAQELQAALRLDSRYPETYVALAELYEKQGRTAEIEPNLQKAVDLAPDYWSGHASLGAYFRDNKRYDEARQEFQKMIELTPDNPSAYGYLGVLHIQQERFQDARVAFEKEVQLAPSFRTYSNLGAVLQLEGKFTQAVEMYQKAIALNSRDYSCWGNLGSSYLWSGDKNKAQDAYRKAIELAEAARKTTPNDARLLVRLGGFYASLGEAKQSIPILRQAVALDPGSATTAYRAGEAYELLQRREEALRWIEKALQLGYSAEYVRKSPELALLRKDPRFKWATK